MTNSIRTGVMVLLVLTSVAAGTFWAGMIWQDNIYTDQCLDMGGGRSPGGHAICVLASPDPPPVGSGVRSAAYQCADGQDFMLLFVGEGRAILDRGPSQPPVELTQVPAASGARYTAGEDSLWIKGGEALRARGGLETAGQTCILQRGTASVKPPAGRG